MAKFHPLKNFAVAFYILFCATLPFTGQGAAQSVQNTTDEFDLALMLAQSCYEAGDWGCALQTYGDIFQDEESVRDMSLISPDRLCNFVRTHDSANVKYVIGQSADQALVQIRSYEKLMQRMSQFSVSTQSQACIRSSREITGAILLLKRAKNCWLIQDEGCAVEALVELELAEGQYSWAEVGARFELDPAEFTYKQTTLRSEFAWTIEIEKRNRLAQRYELGFFQAN